MRAIASAKDPAFSLRLPEDLIRAIDDEAARNGRSRNSEIIVRLRGSLAPQSKSARARAVASR